MRSRRSVAAELGTPAAARGAEVTSCCLSLGCAGAGPSCSARAAPRGASLGSPEDRGDSEDERAPSAPVSCSLCLSADVNFGPFTRQIPSAQNPGAERLRDAGHSAHFSSLCLQEGGVGGCEKKQVKLGGKLSLFPVVSQ